MFELHDNEKLNSALAGLSKMVNLMLLDLSGVEIADSVAKKLLRGTKQLEHLDLSRTLARDDSAAMIAKLRKLRVLSMFLKRSLT